MKRLTILTIALALPFLAACDPTPIGLNVDVESPAPDKPDCVGDVVVLDWFETDTPCDLSPPQRLDRRMADLTNSSRGDCTNRGGTVTIDNAAGTAFCVNIDY